MRVNCIQLEDNDIRAQNNYNNLFYDLESDSEEGTDQQDSCRPLQSSDLPNQPSKPHSEPLEETSNLEVTEGINLPLGMEITQLSDSKLLDTSSYKDNLSPEPSFLRKDLYMTPKIPFNWNTQRRLAREVAKVYHSISNNSSGSKLHVELKKHQAQPPGCSFLGSQATQVPTTINFFNQNITKVIIDLDLTSPSFPRNHTLKCKPLLNFDKGNELI